MKKLILLAVLCAAGVAVACFGGGTAKATTVPCQSIFFGTTTCQLTQCPGYSPGDSSIWQCDTSGVTGTTTCNLQCQNPVGTTAPTTTTCDLQCQNPTGNQPTPNPPPVGGCTNPQSSNYNRAATYDDGSCIVTVFGCTSNYASNYNSHANFDDGSCIYPPQVTIDNPGCPDETALNYNSSATSNDGSCQYAPITNCCPSPVELPDGSVWVYNGSQYVMQNTQSVVYDFGVIQYTWCGVGQCVLLPSLPLTTQQQLQGGNLSCKAAPYVIPNKLPPTLLLANTQAQCSSQYGIKEMSILVALQYGESRSGPWTNMETGSSSCPNPNSCSLPSGVGWACQSSTVQHWWRAVTRVYATDNNNHVLNGKEFTSAFYTFKCQ